MNKTSSVGGTFWKFVEMKKLYNRLKEMNKTP